MAQLEPNMSRFNLIPTTLEGLMIVDRKRATDTRGFFSRFFCAKELAQAGFDAPIAQINHTLTSRKGSVRGLHFQNPPHSEAKLVSCLSGEVFDVAVDLRKGSATFLKWHAEILSENNARSLLIPQGFAHGFQTLTDECELLYLHSCAYNNGAEGALNVRDPALKIQWPLPITDISDRDIEHPYLSIKFKGIQP